MNKISRIIIYENAYKQFNIGTNGLLSNNSEVQFILREFFETILYFVPVILINFEVIANFDLNCFEMALIDSIQN